MVETESGRGQLKVMLTALVQPKSKVTGKATRTPLIIYPAKSGIAAEVNRQNKLCLCMSISPLMGAL